MLERNTGKKALYEVIKAGQKKEEIAAGGPQQPITACQQDKTGPGEGQQNAQAQKPVMRHLISGRNGKTIAITYPAAIIILIVIIAAILIAYGLGRKSVRTSAGPRITTPAKDTRASKANTSSGQGGVKIDESRAKKVQPAGRQNKK